MADNAGSPSNPVEIIIKNEVINNYNRNKFLPEICRICLLIFQDNFPIVCIDSIKLNAEDISLRSKLYFCCPELDLRTNRNTILCRNCFEIVSIINNFNHKCNNINRQCKEDCNYVCHTTQQLSIVENSSVVFKNEIKSEEVNLSDAEGFTDIEKLQSSSTDNKFNITKNNNSKIDMIRGTDCKSAPFHNEEKLDNTLQHDYKHIHKNILNQQIDIQPVTNSLNCLENNLNITSTTKSQDALIHTKEKLFKCLRCSYSSKKSGDLEYHMGVHNKEISFKCSKCNYSAIKKHYLQKHIRIHTGEKPFKCSQCKYSTWESSNLKRHIHIHTRKKPFRCSLCNYSTYNTGHLKRHKRIHTGEKPFKCSQCVYSARESSYLKVHLRIHTGEKPFKCLQCNYSSKDISTLKRHMNRIHSGKKSLKCSQCNYSSGNVCNLKMHMRIHTGEKSLKCFQCNYSTIHKSNLKRHMLIHIEKKLIT